MQKFLSTLVAVAFLLVLGCEKNQVTEPTQSLAKKLNLSLCETIELCCLLNDPAGGCCQLTGEVEYTHQIIESSSREDGLYLISLTLDMNSELCSMNNPTLSRWSIEYQSQDEFYVSEEGIYILEKAYLIENRMDVLLLVQYLVTTEGVGIPNLWLQEIDE
jgi:hypothetical protein